MRLPERYDRDFQKGFEIFNKNGCGAAIGKMMELKALRKGGTEFPIEPSIAALKINNGWNALGIVRDVSVRKQFEQTLKLTEKN